MIRRFAHSGAVTAGQAAVELAYRDPTCARLRAVFGAPLLPKPTLTPFAARRDRCAAPLATASVRGTIHLHRKALGALDDADVIAELTSVPDIGRDAAQMFLITQLQRLDAWPVGDDELRTGYGIAFNTKAPTRAALDAFGHKYRPFRTVVAWYCWQARAHPETLSTAFSPHGP